MVTALAVDQAPDTLSSPLILSGLTVTSAPTLLTSHPNLTETLARLDMTYGQLYAVTASKPNHEVGAARLLSFAKPADIPVLLLLECGHWRTLMTTVWS